ERALRGLWTCRCPDSGRRILPVTSAPGHARSPACSFHHRERCKGLGHWPKRIRILAARDCDHLAAPVMVGVLFEHAITAGLDNRQPLLGMPEVVLNPAH